MGLQKSQTWLSDRTSKQYSIVYMYHNFLIHSFVDGHLGCFDVTSIVNRAAINTGAIVVLQLLTQIWPFETPWTAACQASLSLTISWSLLKCMSIKSVMPSHHSSSVVPFSSCLQSFPESGSFLISQIFSSGGQSIYHQPFQWIFRVSFF